MFPERIVGLKLNVKQYAVGRGIRLTPIPHPQLQKRDGGVDSRATQTISKKRRQPSMHQPIDFSDFVPTPTSLALGKLFKSSDMRKWSKLVLVVPLFADELADLYLFCFLQQKKGGEMIRGVYSGSRKKFTQENKLGYTSTLMAEPNETNIPKI